MSNNQNFLRSNNFSLKVGIYESKSIICMRLFTDTVNTCNLPHTFETLKQLLPSVLYTECFNDEKLPFHEEVKNTEIGHLFEHVLLEYLCQISMTRGFRKVQFSGFTEWNWKRDPKGTFHITIDAGLEIADIFENAVEKSVKLICLLMQPQKQTDGIIDHLFVK